MKEQSEDDKRRDAVLKRMLMTPHKPHQPLATKKAVSSKKKKKT